MYTRKFGRKIEFDPESRDHPIRRYTDGLVPITNMWSCNTTLDQGNEGSCVGHGCAHELLSTPIQCLCVNQAYARYIYTEAKKLDEWPGEDYEGTSVLAGLKVLRLNGWCSEYRWSFEHLDTQLGISYEGPGIAGTNWYSGMEEVDANGFIHVKGTNLGGHCYLFIGVNVEQEYFSILNSWGAWGIDGTGRAKISFEDYELLRKEYGEMAFLIGRKNMCNVEPVDPEDDDSDFSCRTANTICNGLNLVAEVLGRQHRIKPYIIERR